MSKSNIGSARSAAYQRVLGELYSLGKFGIKLGLENITSLLQDLGNPHQNWSSIHIAGSNGKGSVAAFLQSALQAAGYRVGLYTSPHLVDFEERIRVDGQPISRQEVVRLWRQIQPRVQKLRATYFEAVTAMAFEHFRMEEVAVAVVEVGLGGRLDATNVVGPQVTVITSISREHTRWLGSRLDQIAREKAGIIKEGTPVICAEDKKTALRVIKRVCSRKHAPLLLVGEELSWKVEEASLDGTDLLVSTASEHDDSLYVGLPGRHQICNAMTALLTLKVLRDMGWEIPSRAVRQGFSLVQWAGRLQVVRESPMILLDVAHNPAGTRALSAALKEFLPQQRICFVFGVQEDKEHGKMIGQLASLAEKFFMTQAQWGGAEAPRVLAREVQETGVPVQIRSRVKDAVWAALEQAGPQDVICITGSHFVVGEAMQALGMGP